MSTTLPIVQSSKLYARDIGDSYMVQLMLTNKVWVAHPHVFDTKAEAQSLIERIHAHGSINRDLWIEIVPNKEVNK